MTVQGEEPGGMPGAVQSDMRSARGTAQDTVRSAIVTGGGRGIGAAVAERLASDGYAVLVGWGTSEDAAEAVAERIRAAGGTAQAVRCDVSQAEQVAAAFDEATARYGGVDAVVCNAGIGVEAPLAEYELATFERTIAVNLLGTFHCMRQAALRLRDGGRVVSISSGYTRRISAGAGPYAATKAGIEQLGRALALELAPRRITVNTVLPALIETDGITPTVRARIQPAIDAIPLGGLGQPADVAAVVSFLAGPDGRWVTGQELVVSGGAV